MILLILILSIATTLATQVHALRYCPTCILVNTTCYKVSHIVELEAPFRTDIVIPKMGVLRSTNTLYFSFEPVIEDIEYYKTGFVNLNEVSLTGIINGGQILNLGTFDIDQDKNLIYFGGSDGIFVLDTNTNKMSSYSSRGDTITKIFFKNFVYFTKYGEKGIIVKNGDYFRILYDDILVKNFVITKYDVFVILSNKGLYVSKGKEMHKISENPFIRGIAIDLDGTIYAWWLDELYNVVLGDDLIDSELVKVAAMPYIGSMVFDNENNILFTVERSLFVMKETEALCG